MERKYKIKFPNKVDYKQEEGRTRAFLNEPRNRELTKTFTFLYEYQPETASKLAKIMSYIYHIEYSSSRVHYFLERLEKMGLVNSKNLIEASSEESDIDIEIRRKFSSNYEIPANFANRLKITRFYYVTEFGEKFIPWAAEIMGFEVEEVKTDEKV